jgi:hypothetical protein
LQKAYHIEILDVNIYKLEEGVFFSKLHCTNGDKEIYVDSRTSDAGALALRFDCPIYTTEEIIEKAGLTLEIENIDGNAPGEEEKENAPADSFMEQLRKLSVSELKVLLDEAVQNEDYEKASKIRDELKKRS